MKKIYLVIAGILLVSLVFFLKTRPTPIDYYRVKPITLDYLILGSGRFTYPKPYTLMAPVPGRIVNVRVQEGQQVKTGEVLVELDNYLDQRNLDTAQATLTLAELKTQTAEKYEEPVLLLNVKKLEEQVALSQSDLVKKQRLYTIGGLSLVDFQQVQLSAANDRKALDIARLNLESFRRKNQAGELRTAAQLGANQVQVQARQIQDKALKAPFSGVITHIDLKAGQLAQVGQNLLTLLPAGVLELEANLDQKESAYIHSGLPVVLTLDAYPDRPVTGTVTFVSPDIDPTGGTLLVRIAPAAKLDFIKYGMMANLEIKATRLDNLVAVPAALVATVGRKQFVYEIVSGNVRQKDVQATSLGEKFFMIKEIRSGDKLVRPDQAGKRRIKLNKELNADEL